MVGVGLLGVDVGVGVLIGVAPPGVDVGAGVPLAGGWWFLTTRGRWTLSSIVPEADVGVVEVY